MNRWPPLGALALLLFLVPLVPVHPGQSAFRPVLGGVLDLRNAEADGKIWPLEGMWDWYPQVFKDGLSSIDKPQSAKVPGEIKPNPNSSKGHGYGTYRLVIKLDEAHLRAGPMGLYLPYQNSSARISWNGKVVLEAGKLGTNAAEAVPEWKVRLLDLDNLALENELLIETSNFQDNYMGQLDVAWFGDLQGLHDQERSRLALQVILFAALFSLGIYHIGSWAYRRKDIIQLFFALTSILFAFRIFFYTDLFILQLIPTLDFETLQKGGFLTFTLASMLFGLYIAGLFPQVIFGKPWVHRGFVVLASLGTGIYSIMILLMDFKDYIPWLPLVLIYVVVLCLGIILILARALYLRQDGAGLILIGFASFFAMILNDFLTSSHIISTPFLASLGMVIYLFFQSLVSVKRYALAHQRTEDSNQTLAAINQSLERFIPGEMIKILGTTDLSAIEPGTSVKISSTVLVCHIRDLPLVLGQQEPGESFALLNDCLHTFGSIIRQNNGFIERYHGEGVTALFTHGPSDAFKAAREMELACQSLNKLRLAERKTSLKISMGINHGSVMVGTVGDTLRLDSLVCSETMDNAHILQKLTQKYGLSILVGDDADHYLEKHQTEYPCWYLADEILAEPGKPVRIYALK